MYCKNTIFFSYSLEKITKLTVFNAIYALYASICHFPTVSFNTSTRVFLRFIPSLASFVTSFELTS